MKLETTDSEFSGLEAAYLAKRRKGTTTCEVDIRALGNLLKDHSTLLAAATGPVQRGGKGHKVEAGQDQESLK